MEKSIIPRFEMETFEQANFQAPVFNVESYLPDANYFIIKNRAYHPVNDYISPNRRQFYKIFHVTGGIGTLTIGLHQYMIRPGMIAFIHPDEIMSWQSAGEDPGGHFCMIHPDYFENTAHVLNLFRTYPYFQANKAVIELTDQQSVAIDQYFGRMLLENEGQHKDKKLAIFLQLQLIFLEAKRAGKNLPDAAVPESYRYIHGFLALLESAFQVHSQGDTVKIKTAAEFAEQLNVHPNYLNMLVKSQTGKTLREHIQEKVLYEAKVLLKHTDWDIQAISYSLGFAEQASFAAFFHRKEKTSPSAFRESGISLAHI